MKLLYVVAKSEYFLSHRFFLCLQAQSSGFDVAVATTEFLKKNKSKIADINSLLVRFKRGSLNHFIEIRTIFDLLIAFRKFRPSLVHNVALKPALYGAAIARFCGIPSVNAVNGFGYIFTSRHIKARFLRPFVKCALKFILNHSSVTVLVQNQQDFESCKRLLPKSELYLVLGSGVDAKTFYPVVSQGIFTFTLVARMLWSKGVGEFVEAAENFVKNNPSVKVRFLLVGDPDPENPESIPLAILKKWHQEGVVEWLGYEDNIQHVYAQTHVAVLPSYREGLPKSLIEAMACGLPIITTDAIGCGDIVHDGNGIKVPVQNVVALEKAFEKCFFDKKLCEKMGRQGRKESETVYASDVVNRQIIEIYTKILQKI